ncbi:MAG TPA: CPBP family glutamic-type intramembrane protease [Chitinophagaceae bacterium]|nr:CPBP family glutamic-type intramembrane protease [Chitinophagaceae bacterium]
MTTSQFILQVRRGFVQFLFPPLLIILNYVTFHFFVRLTAAADAFLAGLAVYWIFWCLLPVRGWISGPNRKRLGRWVRPAWWQILLVAAPVALSIGGGPLGTPGLPAIAGWVWAAPLVLVATTWSEEWFWRGLYFDHHQGNFFYAVLVPAVWYGVWQYVPLSVYPQEGGNFYYIARTVLAAGCWGALTYSTRSVGWALVSHLAAGLGSMYLTG